MALKDIMHPARIKNFFLEARQEFRHINWPTRNELVYLTTVVIGISLVLAAFLGLFDAGFLYVLSRILGA